MPPRGSNTFPVDRLVLQIVEEREPATGATLASLHVTNTAGIPLTDGWRIYFSLGLAPLESEQRVIRTLIEGRYGYLSPGPAWSGLAAGESMVIPIENWLLNGMPYRARQGFHVTVDGSLPEPPQVRPPQLLRLDRLENDWIPDLSPAADVRPQTADNLFARHAALSTGANQKDRTAASVIPAPGLTAFTGSLITTPGLQLPELADAGLREILGDYECADGLVVRTTISDTQPEEGYQLEINEAGVQITGGSAAGAWYGAQTLRQLVQPDPNGGCSVPAVRIEDAPGFSHRALFIDLARHFQPVDELRRIIRAMSAYKLNRLQLGISNDEGWRLEVPGMPELTAIGARRLFQAEGPDGPLGLYPAWGDDHQEQQAFLTREEFVALLAFARQHHVEVILELNLPAHANALIRSFAASGRFTLTDPDDRSTHRSAQGYTRNVVNVWLPDVYQLARELFQSFTAMYQDAGVQFQRIHLGGDEVPAGAWLHSPACRQSLQALDLWQPDWDPERPDDAAAITRACLKGYAHNILAALEDAAPGTGAGFWHEMSAFIDLETVGNDLERYQRVYFNSWTTEAGELNIPAEILDRDQQMVISNASYLYLDMPHGLHAEESGLPWAGYIDTDTIYHFDPFNSWHIQPNQRPRIKGIQAQLWTETITDTALLHAHLFPRLLAVAERAWRSEPVTAGWQAFAAAVGHRELGWLASQGIQSRLPPPGARVVRGSLEVNTMLPGLDVRYTLDGSDPTSQSPRYEGAKQVPANVEIRLACFFGHRRSRIVSLQG